MVLNDVQYQYMRTKNSNDAGLAAILFVNSC